MTSCRCGASWTGLGIAHCAVCHLTFTTVSNFDAHLDNKAGRCRIPAELREKGYEPNPAGQWRKPIPVDQRPAGWS
jgi:hypothetical protein